MRAKGNGRINAPYHHPVIAAAMAHAQFELIHPFRDGNGRPGRAMIQTILRKHGVTRYTTPPISILFALGRDEYVGSLSAARYEGSPDGPERTASFDPWVSMFTSTTGELPP
jgi:Fic family protein